MKGKFKNSIRLQSQTSLQLWKWGDNGDINRAWDSFRTSKFWPKIVGYFELKHLYPSFDEECSKLVD
jgi:hypothetical protein